MCAKLFLLMDIFDADPKTTTICVMGANQNFKVTSIDVNHKYSSKVEFDNYF